MVFRYCIVPAQATGAAFQTVACAGLLFEGDPDYQLSDEIIREMLSQLQVQTATARALSTGLRASAPGHFIRLALCCTRI
jgi:hypothetical protein